VESTNHRKKILKKKILCAEHRIFFLNSLKKYSTTTLSTVFLLWWVLVVMIVMDSIDYMLIYAALHKKCEHLLIGILRDLQPILHGYRGMPLPPLPPKYILKYDTTCQTRSWLLTRTQGSELRLWACAASTLPRNNPTPRFFPRLENILDWKVSFSVQKYQWSHESFSYIY